MKKWIQVILVLVVAIMGVSYVSVTTEASSRSHYVATPASVRGNWYQVSNNRVVARLTVKKYTVEMESARPSYFYSDEIIVRGNIELPNLYVAKKKTKHGYWMVGIRNAMQSGLKKGGKDVRGFTTLKQHLYSEPQRTLTLYSKQSLKPYVKGLNEKRVDSPDDFIVHF